MKILLILLLVMSLYGDDFDHHNERHINKELSHLNLSKEQKSKIKRILKEFRSDLKEFREYKEDIEEKREKLFISESFDVNEFTKLNEALDFKSYEIENRLLKSLHSILSKKQRHKFIYYFDDWEVE